MSEKHARVLFKNHCYACHDSSGEEAGVNLEEISFMVSDNVENAALWQKILNAINSNEMPPPDEDRIPDELKLRFLEELTTQMVTARKVLGDSGGVVPLRRLNRREYSNTIHSLLGVRPDVSSLPNDQVGSGFDTQGASLFMSSDQIEQYLATARKTLKVSLGVGDEAEMSAEFKAQLNRLMRGSKNSKDARKTKGKGRRKQSRVRAAKPPESNESKPAPTTNQSQPQFSHAEAMLFQRVQPEIEYTPRVSDYLNELTKNYERAQRYLAQSEKPPKAFGILDHHQAEVDVRHYTDWHRQLQVYLERPEIKDGVSLIVTIKKVGLIKVKLPPIPSSRPGSYRIRVRVAAYPEVDERFHYLEFTSDGTEGRRYLGWRKVTKPLDDPQIIEFPYYHEPGTDAVIAIHQRTHQDRGDKILSTQAQKKNGIGLPPGIWIDWAELEFVEEPADMLASRTRILPERPKEEAESVYATRVIGEFASRAFRGRKPTDTYLSMLLKQFNAKRQSGKSLNTALIEPLAIVLASPDFLYMVEKGRKADSQRLSQPELAVRLSYLLWSGPPDEVLMDVAQRGLLDDPGELRRQTERMLVDPRADEFVRDFSHQWLQLDRLGMFQFAARDFPTFDNATRINARDEILETVRLVMKEGLPIGKLLHADFAVLNDLMAGYYGLPELSGHRFRKVALPDDSVRGGLMATAAVNAMGSDGLKSSPVERGAWVLRHLLHDPPAPAPPNVPQLSRLDGKPLSKRELTKLHQHEPQCAQCHRKIDPIGFGLENFNAIGLWRDRETVRIGKRQANWKFYDFDIDPSGTLSSGESFRDYRELRLLVASKHEAFARGFAEELIAYGMGRPFGFTDEQLAEEMMLQAEKDSWTIPSFIHTLVQSRTFKQR